MTATNRSRALRRLVPLLVVLGFGASANSQVEQPSAVLDRAVAQFSAGNVVESAATFDTLVRLEPAYAPFLWQRGIALYYAARYADCRAQFESHRTVNPSDVENAAWHFLCVARAESLERARAALLPVGPDDRVPMREIYQMFRGTMKPEAVLAASGTSPQARFYAHLYIGLFSEAVGDKTRALQEIEVAARDQYAAAGGYMHTVARVHLSRLARPR